MGRKRQSEHAAKLPKVTCQRLAAAEAVGLSYWSGHPDAGYIWAVDSGQQAHVVRVDYKRETAQRVCRKYIPSRWVGDGPAVAFGQGQRPALDWATLDGAA